jgi:hypothetical protein
LETSSVDKATSDDGALAETLFQMPEPRRTGFYKETSDIGRRRPGLQTTNPLV